MDKVRKNRKTIRPKKALLIILLILLTIILIGSIVYFNNSQNNNKQQATNQDQKNNKSIVETNDVNELVKNFGETFNNNTQELRNSNVATWNKEKLDKAYFNLIYADRVNSFSDVYNLLSSIDYAQKNGLDINNNSYGIDQKKRDEIKLRADKSVEAFKKGTL